MLTEKFWVVKNPTEHSEMADVCWETDVNTFARYVLGTQVVDGGAPSSKFEQECHQVHTSERTARTEAQFRLNIRDGILKTLAQSKAQGAGR
jgi:hypothetical protein